MPRKKASVGERALRGIFAELNIRLIHVRRLLEAVEVEQELALPWIDPDEGGGPREIARRLRNAWMLPAGPIDNLTDLVERAGILIIPCRFDVPVDGVTMRLPDLPPCIFINTARPADRMRFSLAHELAHVVMHRVPSDSIEEEANAFAAEFLVPGKELRRDLIGGRVTLERLARSKARWKVSMQFLLFQAEPAGVLNRNQSQYLWKQISRLGWRTHEPAETEFPPEQPKLFPRIVDLHRDQLDYQFVDLARLLHVEPDELRFLYGLHDRSTRKTPLRVIK